MSPLVRFGAPFQGSDHAMFRRRVQGLWEHSGEGVLRVDTVLRLYDHLGDTAASGMVEPLGSDRSKNDRSENDPPEGEATWLLFEPHRMIVYDPPEAGPADPDIRGRGLESLLRALVDGFPFQPFDRLRRELRDRPFPWLYPLATLDLLPSLWSASAWPARRPGRATVVDLRRGEIETCRVPTHPRAIAPKDTPVAPEPLAQRPVGKSLRAAETVTPGIQVSRALGRVREHRTGHDSMSLPSSRATLTWDRGRVREECHGRSADAEQASSMALLEAVERLQVAFRPGHESLILGRRSELSAASIDPRRLLFGRSPHGPHRHAEVLRPFSPDAELSWTPALRVRDGATVLVPAQDVWFDVLRHTGEARYVNTTTNGCALGGSLEEAALFALLEAVERDAYLTAWYLRRPCRRIDPDSIRCERFHMLRHRWRSAYGDYRLSLFDLGGDVAIPTVLAMAERRRGRGPKMFHATASHLSAERACRAAVADLASFVPGSVSSERRRAWLRLLREPSAVRGPEHHFQLYSLDETFERLRFLDGCGEDAVDVRELDRRAWIPIRERYNLHRVLERLSEHLDSLGVTVCLKDLTHPELGRQGLHCARAITPGLYPLWFGYGKLRFAWTDRLARLAELPGSRAVGAPRVVGPEGCQLEFHPFA